jgi:hypothetical protein
MADRFSGSPFSPLARLPNFQASRARRIGNLIMTTRVISFFADDGAGASLHNHRRYSARQGYVHEYVDASAIGWSHQRMQMKYQVLLRALRASDEGELVLLLTQDCVLVREIACETLMQDPQRDWLLICTGHAETDFVLAGFQLWRNTAAARAKVERICADARFGIRFASECELLRPLGPEYFMMQIAGCHPVAIAALHIEPKWVDWPVFAFVLADLREATPNEPVFAGLRDLHAEHVNDCQARGRDYLALPPADATANGEAFEAVRRHAPIALTMLYTPNIRNYGEVAERNLRRYCERHGYALYVYRDIPDEARGHSGNWLKPWVLRRHLHEHEWVFWIDADVLVSDQGITLEPILRDRDRVIATDISWKFNSGIMGFRNTAENQAVLAEIESAIDAVADKSSTYASGGDQNVFIDVMERRGMAGEHDLLDCLTINTPWQMKTPSSFMVHYMGMWPSLRALIMHEDDWASQLLDRRRL